MAYSYLQSFTTMDENNIPSFENCAVDTKWGVFGGGWWYPRQCGCACLNGAYGSQQNGIYWLAWTQNNNYAYVDMKIKPLTQTASTASVTASTTAYVGTSSPTTTSGSNNNITARK